MQRLHFQVYEDLNRQEGIKGTGGDAGIAGIPLSGFFPQTRKSFFICRKFIFSQNHPDQSRPVSK
jgi:hypothetical protein